MNKKLLVVTESQKFCEALSRKLIERGATGTSRSFTHLDEVVVTTYWTMICGRYENVLFLIPYPESPENLMRELKANKATCLLPGGKITELKIRDLTMDQIALAVMRILLK